MRIILKIAKAELRSLFYSPIAWVIAIAFFVVCGVQFSNPLETIAAQQQFQMENAASFNGFSFSLTLQLFISSYSFLLSNLYLFIPLLTMGLISREVHAGTIRLLYSSPITPGQIALGKYLGLMCYNALLLIPVGLLMITAGFAIASPDYLVFFTALLGLYLLTGTYMAIGLFVSSLTGYQVVAALLTFLVFAILNNAAQVFQQYDFFRDLTYFLNISGRVDNLLVGLITSKDIFYFLLTMLMFVTFTLVKLKSRTESRSWYIYLFRYTTIFAVVLLAGYFSSRPAHIAYLDVTRNQTNTIHPAVQKVMAEMGDEPLKVTLYTNILGDAGGSGLPAGRNNYLWGFWGKYLRFHPNIDFHYVYYYDLRKDDTMFRKTYPGKTVDEVADMVIDFHDIPRSIIQKPAAVRSMIDLEPEAKRLVMEAEYKGKKTFLRTYDDVLLWPDQVQMAGGLARLTRDTTPRVLFTTGHYERSPYRSGERDYFNHTLNKLSRGALLNLGVDVDTINLQQDNIPDHTTMLVVADPRSAYTEEEQQKIRSYIASGGNAIFYGEPGKQQMLNPVLDSFGVHLDDGIIVAPNPHEMPHSVIANMTDAGGHLAEEPILYLYQKKESEKLFRALYGSANISYRQPGKFSVQPLFILPGADSIWMERGVFVPDSAAPVFAAQESDLRLGQYTTGISLTRMVQDKEQRIIVCGDADFMSALRFSGAYLGNACYSWVLKNEYPIYTNWPMPVDRLLTINKKQAAAIWVVFVYVIPAIVLAAGMFLLIRRRRK